MKIITSYIRNIQDSINIVFKNCRPENRTKRDESEKPYEQGRKFGQSPELKNAMERAGVISAPEISFAE